ncbi:MAG: toll/interleukin-1 receptor domain-containing protein [Caulobacterales bacterium]
MKIFLSYSTKDTERVAPLQQALQALGHETLTAVQDLVPGDDWSQHTQESLEQSDLVLVCWSAASVASDWVLSEALTAQKMGKLSNALLEAVTLPAPFNLYNALKLEDLSGERLAKVLRLWLDAAQPKASSAKRRAATQSYGESPKFQTFQSPSRKQAAPATEAAEMDVPPFLRAPPAPASTPPGEAGESRRIGAAAAVVPAAGVAPSDVFISYSRKDSEVCRRLFTLLVERGLNPWYDKDIGGGAFKQKIVGRIGEAEVFVLVLSANSMASANVSKELSIASNAGRLIVPIAIDGTGAADLKDSFAYELIELNIFPAPGGDLTALATVADTIRDSVRELRVMGTPAANTSVPALTAASILARPAPDTRWVWLLALLSGAATAVFGVAQSAYLIGGLSSPAAAAIAAASLVIIAPAFAAAAALLRTAFAPKLG